MAADIAIGFLSTRPQRNKTMPFPFQKIFQKRGLRRFILPFGLILAVVFIVLANAAA